MHTSPVLIAIFGLGVVVLLVLIVAYLKSKGSHDQDSSRLLGNINSSLEDIMDRVDNLEAQRKAGAVNENMNQPNRAARSDVDEFLAQFDSGTQFAEQGQVAAEVFGVQETEAGVSNDDFWSDFDRPMKKLDGHDRETQASLKPRSDRPMRLSRQTLVPQGEEQEKMQAEVRRQDAPDPMPEEVNRPFDFSELTVIGAVFNTYILAQDEDAFYMIDQHAAHERVFYEKLMRQYNAAEKLSQQMLVPLTFSVSSEVADSEDSWIAQVRAMGYQIEFFGNNTYIVREIPAFMELGEAEAFLGDLFGAFRDKPDLTDHRTLDKIITRSCKSAVKGGDVLDAAEISALMTQLRACDNPFSCPHGRPTFIKMTRYELEHMFKRA